MEMQKQAKKWMREYEGVPIPQKALIAALPIEGKMTTGFATTYQQRVEEWLQACLPEAARRDQLERTFRFLEEALELAQANGCSQEDAHKLVDYVYGRPHGRPDEEVGGVMVTLASLCSAVGINMNDAGDRELHRNWKRIDDIRRKQAAKPHGSPLPE